jgi:integrase
MPAKPSKPRPDFPLYAHAKGRWAAKIKGETHYFGTWDDWQGAEQEYKDYLAGRAKGGSEPEGLTVKQLCNSFISSKKRLFESGEIRPRTFRDYFENCKRVVKVLRPQTLVSSLAPKDFETLRADFTKTHGPVTLCGDITCTRVLFKYADDTFKVRVNFGQGFRKPSKAVLRRYRKQRQPKMFQPAELNKIIREAGVQLRAMIYLGLNCGFGNNDCVMLPLSALNLNLKRGWIDFPRPKTGIDRRCPLWPETVKALKAAIAARPEPKNAEHSDRVFITKYGHTWEGKGKKEQGGVPSAVDNPISKEFAKLLKSDDVKLYRKGVGFYALRHVFQTVGERSRDKDAVRAIMGHAEDADDMSAVYNEEPIDDSRLRAVTDFVRAWLLSTAKQRQSA